jgi:hypothetical protein
LKKKKLAHKSLTKILKYGPHVEHHCIPEGMGKGKGNYSKFERKKIWMTNHFETR